MPLRRTREELRRHGARLHNWRRNCDGRKRGPRTRRRLLLRLNEETESCGREAQEAALNLEVVEQQAKADARVAELQDQKRLLVREVKNARKALSDAERPPIEPCWKEHWPRRPR